MINSAIIRQDHVFEANEGDSGPKHFWPRQAAAFMSWRRSVEFSVYSHFYKFRIKSKGNTHRYSDPGSDLLNSITWVLGSVQAPV